MALKDIKVFEKKILSFFNDEKVNEVKQLIIGMWANEEYCTSDEVIELLISKTEEAIRSRDEMPWEIDGLVIKVDELSKRPLLG